MSLAEQSRSLSRLLGESVDQLGELFQVEIQLAQAELSEKVSNAGRGATYLIAAAVFAIPVVTLFLAALALSLRDWSGMSLALAFFIAALVGLAFGLVCGFAALNYLKAKNLRPDITIEQIKRDIAAAKDIAR